MSILRWLVLAAMAAAFLPLTGLAQQTLETLVMIVQPEPPTLAAYLTTSLPVPQVTAKIYDGLLEYDDKLQPQPGLAESWSVSPDGKTILFKLRKEVKFHDGKPFTSADARFSIQEVISKFHPRGINTFRELDAVETPDDYTLVLKLKKPAPYLISALASSETPMLPKHLLEGKDIRSSDLANKPLGTGPFRFVEWRRGEFVRLDKNRDYWRRGEPNVDRLIARFIPDSATRTSLIERGEVHYAALGAIPYSDVKKMASASSLSVTTEGNQLFSQVVELTLNTKRPPFDQVKVRQAISYAVDRQFIADTVFFGYAKPATGPMHSNYLARGYYTDQVRKYDVPDRISIANKLLDEAGHPRKANGVRFEITHDVLPYGEEWRRVGEILQQQLAQVGVKVSLRNEDVPTWLRRVYTNYDFEITTNFLFNLSDPVIGMHRGLHSNAIKAGTNFVNGSRWSSERADDIMDRATVASKEEDRKVLYHELQKLVAEEVPNVYLLYMNSPTVMSSKLKGAVTPEGPYDSFNKARLGK